MPRVWNEYCKWRSKYGGMDAALLSKMKAMAEENKRLQRMYAEWAVEGSTRKRVVNPSQRKVMSQWAVQDKSVSIALACATFRISETCNRYRPMRNDENEEITDWLLRLTACHKRWGFGLCFFICVMWRVLDGITSGCIVLTVSWNWIYELSRASG